MEKMFTLEIDERPVEITGKQSKVLKLFAVIMAALGIWLLILTGFLYVTYQPSNSVQPLSPNTPEDDQDSALPQNSIEADPLTFIFQNSLSKSNLSNGNFTCSIQNSEHPCSNLLIKWNNFIKSTLQIQFLESYKIDSVFYLGKLTFDHNNNVIYKVREKYGFKDFDSKFDELNAETVFKSKEFDWNQKVSFGPDKKTIMTNESFQNELNDMEYSCPIGQRQHLCYILQPSIKTMTSLAKTVFSTTVFNLTWTMGMTSDLHMIVSEYEMIGKIENGTPPRVIINSIGHFDEKLTSLCNCIQQTNKQWNDCFSAEGNDFKETLHTFTNLCPSELEKRINRKY